MPEGHTLHRIAGELTAAFAGEVTRSSSPQGRFAVEAAKIDGLTMDGAEAVGKHLFVHFGEHTVHVHLGLAGKLTIGSQTHGDGVAAAPRPADVSTIRWRLESGGGVRSDLRGPAACALITPGEVDAIASRLGPDPLRENADPDRAWQRVRRSKVSIGALLMDQAVIAGAGNIFRAEVLYRQRLDPAMPGQLLKPAEWKALWADLVELMRYGVRTGRIDTVRPEHEPEAMGRPPRVDPHGGEVYVYRRSGLPCLVCGTSIRLRELVGRNLFWCPRCQPPTRRRVPQR